MDAKCVRVLRLYDDADASAGSVLYVDRDARESLGVEWETEVLAKGRLAGPVVIKPLKDFDEGGFIARAPQSVLDKLFVEYGEEILLYKK